MKWIFSSFFSFLPHLSKYQSLLLSDVWVKMFWKILVSFRYRLVGSLTRFSLWQIGMCFLAICRFWEEKAGAVEPCCSESRYNRMILCVCWEKFCVSVGTNCHILESIMCRWELGRKTKWWITSWEKILQILQTSSVVL